MGDEKIGLYFAELAGMAGMIASLVFVGLEVRQRLMRWAWRKKRFRFDPEFRAIVDAAWAGEGNP